MSSEPEQYWMTDEMNIFFSQRPGSTRIIIVTLAPGSAFGHLSLRAAGTGHGYALSPGSPWPAAVLPRVRAGCFSGPDYRVWSANADSEVYTGSQHMVS